MFWIVIGALTVISFLWALWSLRGLLKQPGFTNSVKQQLKQGRVIFEHSEIQQRHKLHSEGEDAFVSKHVTHGKHV